MRSILVFFVFYALSSLFALAQAPPEKGFATRDPRYRIQTNDVVEVQFRYTPEFNFSATVAPDGYISSQVTGDVHVAGLTLTEAGAAIQKPAASRLKDPDVTVLLRDFVKPHFVVAGEVAHPGSFELHGDVGIIQAIAMSGGFKDSAKRSQVILLRRVNAEFAEVKVLDLKKLMDTSGIKEDVPLRPDDMLVVPRNRITKIEPFLRIASLGMYGLTMGLP
jgi:polysaccharide export outer membrane protein